MSLSSPDRFASSEDHFWSSHALELEGCPGPRFQLLVNAPYAAKTTDDSSSSATELDHRRPLCEANLITFCQEFAACTSRAPKDLELIANCKEWHERLHDGSWAIACQAIGECHKNLQSLGFTIPFCRSVFHSRKDTPQQEPQRHQQHSHHKEGKLQTLFRYTPHLQKVAIQDGLIGYTDTFVTMRQTLHELSSLSLKDASYGTANLVSHDWCVNLANLIASSTSLQHFELKGICFQSMEDWQLIETALQSKTSSSLQTVHLEKLTMVIPSEDDGGSDDFFVLRKKTHTQDITHQASSQFEELRHCMQYLQAHHTKPSSSPSGYLDRCPPSYTLSQRLDALLHVRQPTKQDHPSTLTQVRQSSLDDLVTALSCVGQPPSNQNTAVISPDFVFQLLRQEADPSIWATASTPS